MGLPRTLYRLKTSVFGHRTPRQAHPATYPDRPPGPLVWIHVGDAKIRPVLDDLILRLTDQMPDLWFLITHSNLPIQYMPDHCYTLSLPDDTAGGIARFLDHWKPDVLAWLNGVLVPGLLSKAAERKIPLYLFDSGGTLLQSKRWSILPAMTGVTLRSFQKILVGDEHIALELRQAGALDSQIETIGVLERDIEVLPCNEAERAVLAQLLLARPIWTALNVDPNEYEPVIGAHVQAMRRAHRLLLIISPTDLAQGDEIARFLSLKGILFARRSADEEPDSETQVYIADTDEEDGLWLRLSPVAYIGQTFPKVRGKCQNPFAVAALGNLIYFINKNDAFFSLINLIVCSLK